MHAKLTTPNAFKNQPSDQLALIQVSTNLSIIMCKILFKNNTKLFKINLFVESPIAVENVIIWPRVVRG